MELIVLRGSNSVGKSETLNIVYQFLLLFGFVQVPGHFKVLGNPVNRDCRDILEKRGQKIGIGMMGDYESNSPEINEGEDVQGLIKYFENHGCKKVVIACNVSLKKALAFISTYHHVIVDKTVTTQEHLKRIANSNDAEKIYKLT